MALPLKELVTKGRHATRPAGVARAEQQSQTEENQAGVGHCMVYVGLSPDKSGVTWAFPTDVAFSQLHCHLL